MKYTIFGFSQEQVLNLCDEHQSIDERDLMILRWIMDFYFGGMEKLVIDGAEYGWVNASYVCDELPIMHLNPEAVRRRLKKLVKFGLLYHRQVKNSEVGTRAYYRPTERAAQISDPSIINPSIKCDSPSRKRETRHKYGEYQNVLLSDTVLGLEKKLMAYLNYINIEES